MDSRDNSGYPVSVACQGAEGSYSQEAAKRLFDNPRIVYMRHFEGVFQAVDKGLCQYGVLPVENSITGSVEEVQRLMKTRAFQVVNTVLLPVRHCLLVKASAPQDEELRGIAEIVSHEQAIWQCSEFLARYPHVKVTVCPNTAVAARTIAESDRTDLAAISSCHCARLYGLKVLKENIQNTDDNFTKFICIARG